MVRFGYGWTLTGQATMTVLRATARRVNLGIKLITCLAIGLATGSAPAGQVDLIWEPNTESDLAGYRVHYGTASRAYSVHIDVGYVTGYTVPDLMDGVVYYFAATAYDTSGNESGYSEEAVHAPDPCDMDFDGDVDGSDLAAFIAAYDAGLIEADLNLDIRVDGSDASVFARQFAASD
jgi:hypothetical protein